jgi:TRAP-type C4-dicarboxylate transport system permease small subunit
MGKKFFDIIDKTVRFIISVLLVLMTLVIFYQVVLRYGFHSSNIWAEEFARYAFIWVVMLGSGCAMRAYKHIRVDFFLDRMEPKVRYYVELGSYILMLITLVMLTYYGMNIAARTTNLLSAGLHVSKGFMYSSIPVGCILMILFIIEILANDFGGKKGNADK